MKKYLLINAASLPGAGLLTGAALLAGCVALLAGCSWLHRSKPAPDRPEIIVTGIAPGAFVYVDGVQVGDAQDKSYRSRIIDVAPGNHVVEIKMGDIVTYHETAYAGPGDKRYVTVLSGNTRN